MYRLVLILIFIAGISLALLIPPMQKSDESRHFLRSVMVSKGIYSCNKQTYAISVSKELFQFIDKYQPLTPPKNMAVDKLPEVWLKNPTIIRKQNSWYTFPWFFGTRYDDKKIILEKNICGLPAFPYVIHAGALVIADKFHMTEYPSFYFGRIVFFLFSFIWIVVLLKYSIPEMRPIILYVFALPMTIHQITSYSYDGFSILLGMTLFVLLTQKNTYLPILFIVSYLFVMSKKSGYELLIGAVGIFYREKIVSKRILYLGSILLFFTGLIISFHLTRNDLYIATNDRLLILFGLTSEIWWVNVIRFAIYFLYFICAFLITFTINIVPVVIGMIGLFGTFGVELYALNPLVYFFYIAAAGYLLMNANLPSHLFMSRGGKVVLFFLITGVLIHIHLGLYIFNSPKFSPYIVGVQGRYFIILVPFVYLLIGNWGKMMIKMSHFRNRIILSYRSIEFISIVTMLLVIYSVYNRYY